MDWSKAKNILIIAFIVTNLFLLYVIRENNNSELHMTVEEDFIENLESRLLEKNIKIDTDIPRDLPSLPLLTVEYEIYDEPKNLAPRFLGNYTKENDENGDIYYTNGEDTLRIENNKKIVLEINSGKKDRFDSLNKSMTVDIAKDFLVSHDFDTKDITLSSYSTDNGKYYLEYTKKYKDMFVEITYMKFEIDPSGVRRFERQWISTVEPKEKQIPVRPAPDSLLRLLLKEEHYGKTIKDIRLCYYFDPEKQSLGDWKNIVKGQASPAWRVLFDDGSKEFLEEY